MPENYERRQTLANAERYITPELKERESLILGADERINELEYELFVSIREQVQKHVRAIQANSRALAVLDVLQSLAKVAVERNYVRPPNEQRFRPASNAEPPPPLLRPLKGNLCLMMWFWMNHSESFCSPGPIWPVKAPTCVKRP